MDQRPNTDHNKRTNGQGQEHPRSAEPFLKRRRVCSDDIDAVCLEDDVLSRALFSGVFELPDDTVSAPCGHSEGSTADIHSLPDEILALVLARLPCLVRVGVSLVCRRWHALVRDRAASPDGLCLPTDAKMSMCASAAARLHSDCVDHALSLGWQWTGTECEASARCGRADLFARFYDAGCATGHKWSPTVVATAAAQRGHVNVLDFMRIKGLGFYSRAVSNAAARGGHLSCLRWLHSNGHTFDSETCCAAATGGHLDCLRYLHEIGCPWDENVAVAAVTADEHHPYAHGKGHLDCLRYLHENGCPWDETACEVAVRHGDVECLAYLLDSGCPCEDIDATAIVSGSTGTAALLHAHGYRWSNNVICEAASFGAWELVDTLRSYGCPWDEYVCRHAASSGDIIALERARAGGCPWDMDKCMDAAIAGDHVDVARWLCDPPNECILRSRHFVSAIRHGCSITMLALLRQRDCPFDVREITAVAAARCNIDALDYMLREHMIEPGPSASGPRLYAIAARDGRLDTMQRLHDRGHRPDGTALTDAISNRHEDCIQWLIDHQCPVGPDTLLMAVTNGSLEHVRYLRGQGCPWHSYAQQEAARCGRVDCLTYMAADGWPCDSEMFVHASGRVEVLRYLHERGVAWHPNTCVSVFGGVDPLACLVYAHTHGCPIDVGRCIKLATICNDARCLRYLMRIRSATTRP